jgi:membrane-associated phospholipid phosphatase
VSRSVKNLVERGEEKEPRQKVKFDYHSSRFFVVLFPSIYTVILGITFIVYHIIPGFEFLILIFLIYSAYNNKTWRFVKDWLPFLLVFMSYEAMNSLVGTISIMNLQTGPYNLELTFFGGTAPSLMLQQYARNPILDYMGAVFYTLYFFIPTVFGFVAWRASRKDYWKYTISLCLLTYSSLITFLVYPVAPPWLNPALTVQGVTRILTTSVDKSLGLPVFKVLYSFFGPNLYAAYPSLHSALSWLVFLFAYKIWRRRALPVLVFPIGTWFSAVYLGEHYVTDVLGGIAYATFAFVIVVKLLPHFASRINFLKKHVPGQN